MCVIAFCFLTLQPILAAEDKDKPAAEANSLAQYYGFGPMEILKLQWKLGEPIIADINADGLNDLVFVNNRQAKIDRLHLFEILKNQGKLGSEKVEDNPHQTKTDDKSRHSTTRLPFRMFDRFIHCHHTTRASQVSHAVIGLVLRFLRPLRVSRV